ncbi:outer membrane protein assembly factor BamC [Aliikangiella maris]|uniref:Outer membrane protein assembly factor BamC n=2 Tax=Aliikangiella maris TaxID=3162458 RepID=A0ABV3MJY4_9GAMM
MNLIKIISLFALASLLSACSLFYGEDGLIKDTSYDYLKAKETAPLKIPPHLKHENNVNYTVVPAIGEQAKNAPSGKDISLVAPAQILDVLDNIRANKQSPVPAIYIVENEEFLWDTIINLFTEQGVKFSRRDKANRVLETEWVAVDKRGVWLGIAGEDDIDEFKAKFRIALSEGILKDEKQITVERIAAQMFNDDTDKWQDMANYWHDSAEMLNLIIAHYDTATIERDRNSKNAVVAGFKVQLAHDDNNNAALVTETDKALVWEKLPKVLEALDFDVKDRDRRLMTYFIAYEYEEPGFFASLFDEEQTPLPLESGDYQVTVTTVGELTAIVFRDGQGTPLNAETMVKLYPQLNKLFSDKK